jgi:hypothetical protein
MIKRVITNVYLISVLAIAVGGMSLYFDFYLKVPHWFQRSGSIITILGAILSARKLISKGIKESIESEYVCSGGDSETDFSEIAAEAKKNVQSAYIGIFFIIIGTVIWGYGDIISKLINCIYLCFQIN